MEENEIPQGKCLVKRYEDGKLVSETLEDAKVEVGHSFTLWFRDSDFRKLEALADADNQFVKDYARSRLLDLIGVKYGKIVKSL